MNYQCILSKNCSCIGFPKNVFLRKSDFHLRCAKKPPHYPVSESRLKTCILGVSSIRISEVVSGRKSDFNCDVQQTFVLLLN